MPFDAPLEDLKEDDPGGDGDPDAEDNGDGSEPNENGEPVLGCSVDGRLGTPSTDAEAKGTSRVLASWTGDGWPIVPASKRAIRLRVGATTAGWSMLP